MRNLLDHLLPAGVPIAIVAAAIWYSTRRLATEALFQVLRRLVKPERANADVEMADLRLSITEARERLANLIRPAGAGSDDVAQGDDENAPDVVVDRMKEGFDQLEAKVEEMQTKLDRYQEEARREQEDAREEAKRISWIASAIPGLIYFVAGTFVSLMILAATYDC